MFRHVKILHTPNSTNHETVVAYRSDCERENRELILDSNASLHVMSKTEYVSGDIDTGSVRQRF